MYVKDFQWLVDHQLGFNRWPVSEDALRLVREGILAQRGDWCELTTMYRGFAEEISACKGPLL